jgi:hypothetical protein
MVALCLLLWVFNSNNSAPQGFGGAVNGITSTLVFDNCTFTNNLGYYGGCVSAQRGSVTTLGGYYSGNSGFYGGTFFLFSVATVPQFHHNGDDDND